MESVDVPPDFDESTEPGATLSPQKGWYLLAVYRLSSRGERRVRTCDLAERLDVRPASVTEMATKVAGESLLICEKYAGLEIPPRGTAIAESLARRQCVVASFFDRVLSSDLDGYTAYRIGYELPEDGVLRLG